MEDEMHMLFLCPFSKAAWFSSPWFLRIEVFAANHNSVPQMIQAFLTSAHPQVNITSLYTFLWCLWKARNDAQFGRKICKPSQVFPIANAIMQASKLDEMATPKEHCFTSPASQLPVPQQDPSLTAGNVIFCDAAWKNEGSNQSSPAGIGIIIQTEGNQHCRQLHISALSPPVSSPLQAEAFGLLLATMLAEILHIQEPRFYTDCSVLASAVAAKSIFKDSGHWVIRPILAAIRASSTFHGSRISHTNRCFNVKAHHQAKLACKIKIRTLAVRCLSTDSNLCPGRDILSMSSVNPFTLLSVKCC
jgi:hypothetical protein